jgi:very-short-patch-repair endonuclease
MHEPTPIPEALGPSFTIGRARERGLTYGRLRGTDLERPFHGVRALGPADDLVQHCMQYAERMLPDEFFSSVTAARIHGLPLPRDVEDNPALHVAVPNPRRAPRSKGVVGHKFIVHPARGEVVELHGMRVSSPERAWCELGPQLDLLGLVAAGDQVIRPANRLSSAARLRATLERHPARRGRETLHHAFSLLDPGSESPKETELRLIFVDAGLRGFRANLQVAVPGRRKRRRIDLAFEREKVAVEYQGDHHRDPGQWREDMTRLADLESIGWKVVYVNADDLRDPDELVARIRRVLAARS